jgi:accessory gene regulator B
MLKKISTYISNFLVKNLELSDKEGNYINYGLQVTLGFLIELISLLFISYILGILMPVLFSSVSFLILRPYAGGIHMPRYSLCLISSLILFIIIGELVQLIHPLIYILYIWLFITLVFGLIMINRYAPADTPQNPIKNEKKRKRLKRISVYILISWFLVSIIFMFINNKYSQLIFAGSLGIMAEVLALHPVLFSLINRYLPEHD